MDTTIQFADTPIRPTKSNESRSVGGVYPIRSRSRSRGRSKSSFELQKIEIEDAEDEDAGLRNEGDYKRKQVCWPRVNIF